MAYPFPLLMLWIAVVVSVSTFPATSTSRNSLGGFARKGFRATLRRVHSGGNLTGLERLSRAASRGALRLSVAGTEVESRVRPGSGEFLVEMSIGTPPAPFEAIVDTGSDLIWTQCKPCRLCFPQRTPVFDPEKSSSFSRLPCSSNLCSALPVSSCGGGCEYTYSYGDYSTTQGVMATEVFTFDGNVTAGKVAFGCSGDNEGSGFNGGGSTSTLLMGAIAGGEEDKIGNSKKVTTPLVRNPSQPSFYYITLEGISLGRTRLPVAETAFKLNSDGSGGTIVDSGTTLTYLNGEAFGALKEELKRQMGHLAADESGATGLDLCFRLPPDAEEIAVPKLTLHLGGGADLELPGENYVVADKSYGVACLAMGSSSGGGGGGGGEGGMSIIGNIQQQNMMVIHDLVKDSISFVPTNCDHI
ncbi:unnamed protein product [Cuscuta campestris]|uniref:Peptidase A1 domain-containing protein n=1 Tax=Cuscuta campestris TaxID=132261 RepID=A0A484LNT2_9ASTE|nr:unnamed protein product [Cuscuta campestris]